MKNKLLSCVMLLAACTFSIFAKAQSWSSGTNILYSNPSTTNVGIGITSPSERLQVNNGALKVGNSSSASDRSINMIKIGDGSYIQIGEWEDDDMLSFKANKYNFTNGYVGIGTSSPLYKLDVRGTIRADEIIVNNVSGADFVFEKSYKLRPLSELNIYVQQNQHLPEIPSAAEIQKNGVNMNELQIQLLQKVEELTLYIIQQEQRIQELEDKLNK